jgi:hypothetical protein
MKDNYTTNSIGIHFEIGKEYIALQGKQGISRVHPGARDGKNAERQIRHPGVTPKGCIRER